MAAALDAAAQRWPDLTRAQLLVRLALTAHEAARAVDAECRRRRRDAILEHSGVISGVYEHGYLSGLREDWPA